MHLAPGEGLHGNVEVVGACAGHFQHRCGAESGAAVTVVLHLDMGIFLLDFCGELPQEAGTAHSGHILEADFVCPIFHEVIDDSHIVFYRMHGGIGNGKGALRNHSGLFGVRHAEAEVAVVVEATEGTGDVCALGLLDLEHQFPHVGGDGVHTEGVQAPFKHMCLDTGLVEGGGPYAHRLVGVLSIEQVHLLEGAAIGLYPVEASHVDYCGGNADKLVCAWLVFARRLPHIPIDE